ncbi:50S ribosomal protein L11 [Candidatus Woesearchaeota archaeon]|nr:50S ribosomal protein L11 [Candidatus Woesearchaeota archaeon]
MAKETVDALVDGGKASAAPPLGPALGPLKINIGQVVAEINKKTAAFAGMKVPVKIIVDSETKAFEITVGTPPVSGLIQKELNIKGGSGIPNKLKVGNLAMEDAIKIAQMKMDSLSAGSLKAAVKTVIGSANAMGVLVEGKTAMEINPEVDQGKYDKVIQAAKTAVAAEKRTELANQLSLYQKKFAGELAKMDAAKKEKAAAAAAKKEATAAAAPAAAAAAPAGKAAPAAKAAPAKK